MKRTFLSVKKTARTAFAMLFLLCLIMGIATFTEKYRGTEYVHGEIYGSLWFTALWAVAALCALICLIRRRIWKRPVTAFIHLSLLLILSGALLTHITSRVGYIHLRCGETAEAFIEDNGAGGTAVKLPFSVTLLRFSVSRYAGSDMPSDYISTLRIVPAGSKGFNTQVSMNRIVKLKGIRLYQSSYDDDMMGTTLSVNSDPYGIPVTYCGYALLFISLILQLFSPDGMMRRAFAGSRTATAATAAALLILLPMNAHSQNRPCMSRPEAAEFGEIMMNYEGRIAPVETFATDMLRKITGGKSSYKGLTPTQVLSGWIFFPHQWEDEPIISIGSNTAKALGLRDPASFTDIAAAASYIPAPEIERRIGKKEMNRLSEKADIIYSVERGTMLRIFPVHSSGGLFWYSCSDSIPPGIPTADSRTVREAMTAIFSGIVTGNTAITSQAVSSIRQYQKRICGSAMPSAASLRAEHLINVIPFTSVLFKVNLTLGILALILVFTEKRGKPYILLLLLSWISLAALLMAIVLRTIVAARIPLSNGYETMLAVAFLAQLSALLMVKRSAFLPAFGLLTSGFMLLVASLQASDPKITPLMPVLSSPLLGFHVSVIMLAYALLSLTFLSALTAVVAMPLKGSDNLQKRLAVTERMLLPPAVTALAVGIFTGAIWANISWGSYWSWDSKEVWSLITLIIYSFPLHSGLFPSMRRNRTMHIYIVAAYLTVAMTYFGVNILLPGIHSYSGM